MRQNQTAGHAAVINEHRKTHMSRNPSYEDLENRIIELERAVNRLNGCEAHFRRILDCHGAVIYTKDLNGQYTYVNRQFEILSGLSAKAVIGKTDFELFPASVAQNSNRNDRRVVRTKTPLETEEFGPVGGRMHRFLSVKHPLAREDGEIYGICGISTDIDETKKTEAELDRSKRALIVLKETGKALLRAVDESSLIRESCRILVEDGGYSMAWVGYADDSSNKIVTPVGHWGIRADYLNHIRITWDDSLAGEGPAGKAIRTSEPHIVKNIATDPHFAPWRDAALDRGFSASIGLPLRRDGACFGALSIYASEPDAFDSDEVDLLRQLAAELACGIVSLRNRNAHEATMAALRESDTRLRTLIETIPDMIWLKDQDGVYITCNRRFERFFGAKESEIRGKTDYDFVDDALAAFFREKDKIAIASGEPAINEEEVTFADDGHQEILETIKTPMHGPDGTLIGVLGIARDITDRKRTEAELARSAALFRGLFDHMTSGCAIYAVINDGAKGSDYIIKEFNKKSLEIEGQTLDQVVGRSLFDLRPNIDAYGLIPVMKQVRETGIPAHYPAKIYRDENFANYYENNIFKLPTGEIVTIYNDVTEQKCAEKKILSEKRTAERYLNVAGVMFIGLDTEGSVTLANRKACHILECEETDVLSKNWFDHFIPQSSKEKARAIFAQLVQGRLEQAEYYEGPVVSKSGKEKIIAWRNTHITDDDGRIVGVLGSGEDITEKRLLEARLQNAQKMESIGTLAGGIAHDFNNILSPIIGMSELLLDDLRPGSIEHENAGEILRAGLRGKDLVAQILAFSRKAEHELMPVGVQHILKETLKLIRATIPSYIEISQDIQSDCGPVMGDGGQIHQVVMNLITNAYHAVEETGGKISVGLKEIEITDGDPGFDGLDPGGYALLTISDTGRGIDPELMTKIFDPYFTTKARGKGTGLGLAVVFGIVKAHKGDVKVYSEPGNGAVFKVYLPLMKKTPAQESSETPEPLPGGTERILLVDDEAAIVRLETQMLERLGYVVTARTGSIDALETFRARPTDFDLVVTDMTMPDMTGDRLAEALLSIRPDIPIIVCTGFSERLNREAAARIGINGMLMKPVVKSELAKTVRETLDTAMNTGD